MAMVDQQRLEDVYIAAWNSHDPDAVAAFFAPDAVYDDRGPARVACGREEIRDHVATVDEAGLVTHLVSYYDGAAIMRALGLLPARDSRLERAFIRAASLVRR